MDGQVASFCPRQYWARMAAGVPRTSGWIFCKTTRPAFLKMIYFAGDSRWRPPRGRAWKANLSTRDGFCFESIPAVLSQQVMDCRLILTGRSQCKRRRKGAAGIRGDDSNLSNPGRVRGVITETKSCPELGVPLGVGRRKIYERTDRTRRANAPQECTFAIASRCSGIGQQSPVAMVVPQAGRR